MKIINRLKNVGTIITIGSLVVLILTINGVKIDNDRVMTSIQVVCGIGVVLGILNNPDTGGLDIKELLKK
jgi:uncharacterized membrane protein